MRLSAALIAIAAGVAQAGFGLNFGGSQVTINEDLKIPGDSPLELCPKAHDLDILTIEKVDLSPNPPQAYVTPGEYTRLSPGSCTNVSCRLVELPSSSRPLESLLRP